MVSTKKKGIIAMEMIYTKNCDIATWERVATCQRHQGCVAVIDMSKSLDTREALSAGVDLNSLLVSQPEDLKSAWDIVNMLSEVKTIYLCVVINK